MKIKSFECPKCIRSYNAWNIRRLVDESFVPTNQGIVYQIFDWTPNYQHLVWPIIQTTNYTSFLIFPLMYFFLQNIKFLYVVSTLIMRWRWTEWSTRWLLLFCYNYMQMTWEWFFFSSPTTNDAFSQVEVTWENFSPIRFYRNQNMLVF